MPDNEEPRFPEPESEEFGKFKAAMLRIVSVRKEDIKDKLAKKPSPGKIPRNKVVQGQP